MNCEACLVARKATRVFILRDEPGKPKSVLDLCNEHYHMAKAKRPMYLVNANPALEGKIRAALERSKA